MPFAKRHILTIISNEVCKTEPTRITHKTKGPSGMENCIKLFGELNLRGERGVGRESIIGVN